MGGIVASIEHVDVPATPDARKTVVDQLLTETDSCEFFHDGDVGYAVVPGQPRRVYPVRSKCFRDWLNHQRFTKSGRAAGGQQMQDAVNALDARARFNGEPKRVYMRVANLGDKILLDLCDEKWRVVEITKSGWKVLDESSVPFIRKPGMAALPVPRSGATPALIKKHYKLEDSDLVLVVAWLLAALRGQAPYPVLVLIGEHGSGKSTLAKMLREVVDPSVVPLRSPPRDDRDVAVMATNSYIINLDNLSGLSAHLSDSICRLATGGGFSTRALYTDQDEVLIPLQRPVILNGIDDFATRPDLIDRSLILTLPTITNRRTEEQIWGDFEQDRSSLLGGLLDAVSTGLRRFSEISVPELPRMADFAKWGVAAEPAFGVEGSKFMEAYRKNIRAGVTAGIAASTFAMAVEALIKDIKTFEGVPSKLLDQARLVAPESASDHKAWPAPNKVRNELRRLAPSLRASDIRVDLTKSRSVRLEYSPQQSTVSSQSTCEEAGQGVAHVDPPVDHQLIAHQSSAMKANVDGACDDSVDNDDRFGHYSINFLVRDAASDVGIPVSVLSAELSSADRLDRELMNPEWLRTYAIGLAGER